jgi:hypothetical protein
MRGSVGTAAAPFHKSKHIDAIAQRLQLAAVILHGSVVSEIQHVLLPFQVIERLKQSLALLSVVCMRPRLLSRPGWTTEGGNVRRVRACRGREVVLRCTCFVPDTQILSGFGGLGASIAPKSLMREATTGTNPTLSAILLSCVTPRVCRA